MTLRGRSISQIFHGRMIVNEWAGKSMMMAARQSGILDDLFARDGGLFGRRRCISLAAAPALSLVETESAEVARAGRNTTFSKMPFLISVDRQRNKVAAIHPLGVDQALRHSGKQRVSFSHLS